MKAKYEKPVIEFEEFELNSAIATGCSIVVSLGPGDDTHKVCEEYEVDLGTRRAARSLEPAETNFYEESCTCYLSSGDTTMFTS